MAKHYLMNRIWLGTALIVGFGFHLLPAGQAEEVKNSKQLRGKRFVYSINDDPYPHSRILEDVRVTAQSPWLTELQKEIEGAFLHQTEPVNKPSCCCFDLEKSGRLVNLRAIPTESDISNQAIIIARKLGSVRPLTGPIAEHNKVTIQLQVQLPYCFVRQTLTPLTK